MKHNIVIVIFILSLSITTKAQNLVYNGYFEIYDTCVTNPGQISYAVGWHPCTETPDYYNVCSNGISMKVPYTFHGYQRDCCGGGGYAGGFMFNTNSDSARDYIYTKLIDTLKAGHKYLVSMYVNLNNNVEYAIATMGILFTDTATVVSYTQGFIVGNPQVKNTTIIADTVNWTLIQDTIVAVGNEAYLTIGNFNVGITSDTVRFNNVATLPMAYYYIDGVSVYDIATMGIEQLAVNNEQLNIYPNPSNGNMAVEYKMTEDADLQILDINGNLVCTYNLKAGMNTLSISNDLSNGVYFYRMVRNNMSFKCYKLVIIK